eukprot:31309-Pelagococcus_subviridis.AAC.7
MRAIARAARVARGVDVEKKIGTKTTAPQSKAKLGVRPSSFAPSSPPTDRPTARAASPRSALTPGSSARTSRTGTPPRARSDARRRARNLPRRLRG